MIHQTESESPQPVAEEKDLVGVAQPRLVMRSYSRECDGDRERMLEMALRDLWRNYPEWPSTFGPCHNPDCDGSGRGSGFCAKCVTEGIADIVGMNGPAEAMRRAIEDARGTASKLREMVSPHNDRTLAGVASSALVLPLLTADITQKS